MKKFLFVGLGNPGEQYGHTRHNAGWIAIDRLIDLWKDPAIASDWKMEKKLNAEVLRLNHADSEIIFLKPQTFMNESGQSVAAAMKWFFQIDPTENDGLFRQVVIFHDDLDLTLGQYKLQFGTGPKMHNGVNSIRTSLHSSQFWSARIGVDGRGGQRLIPGQAYVLQPFQSDEEKGVKDCVQTLAEELPYTVLQ